MSGESFLGPYELGELLAEGGTSVVYAATREEGSYRRPVAIKILRQELAGTEEALRFRDERQVLARLEHPHIARLYDGGTTPEGRPFLVMERVDGLPLDAYCDRQNLGVEERLALFLEVCGAVRHAHHHLLVHRDLKPSNILVDAGGEPKLLDFGIAKRIQEGQGGRLAATRHDPSPLTPSYASPEQVQGGAITTASDVYSLGVILYRLLTGRSPYGSTPASELERAICETEPDKPSAAALLPASGRAAHFERQDAAGGPEPCEALAAARRLTPQRLARRLRGDLDTLALKALAKEPERRYRSVAELADEIERHLAGRPLIAHPDTAAYVAWKFARRHRASVLFTALLLALLGGWIVATELRQKELERERQSAQRTFEFLIGAFQRAAPRDPAALTPASAVIDSATRSVRTDLALEPAIQSRLLLALGRAYWDQRHFQPACRLFERSLALELRYGEANSQPLAQSLVDVATCRDLRGDPVSALSAAREAVRLYRRFDDVDPLERAAASNVLGDILNGARRPAEAEPLLRQAVELVRGAGYRGLDLLTHHLMSLGRAEIALGRYAEAERHYRGALQLQSRLYDPENRMLLFNEQRLASALLLLGRTPEAEARLRRMLAVQQRLGYPAFDRARSLTSLSSALAATGRLEEAIAVGREGLAIFRSYPGEPPELVLNARLDLALFLCRRGGQRDPGEGGAQAQAVLAALQRSGGESSQRAVRTLSVLAACARAAGRFGEALAQGRESLDEGEALLEGDDPSLTSPLREIGLTLLAQGKDREALPPLERAHRILVLRRWRPSALRAEIDLPLAGALLRVGRGAEVPPLLAQTEERVRDEFGPHDPRLAEMRQLVALSLRRNHDLAAMEAEQ